MQKQEQTQTESRAKRKRIKYEKVYSTKDYKKGKFKD